MASLTNHRRGNQRQQIAFVGFEHYSTIRFFFSFTMLSLGTKKKSRELVEKESNMELIGKTHQQKQVKTIRLPKQFVIICLKKLIRMLNQTE
jgi:hypothetical protein